MRERLGISDTPPPGGLFHVAAIGADGNVRIVEVWETREQARGLGRHGRSLPVRPPASATRRRRSSTSEVHSIVQPLVSGDGCPGGGRSPSPQRLASARAPSPRSALASTSRRDRGGRPRCAPGRSRPTRRRSRLRRSVPHGQWTTFTGASLIGETSGRLLRSRTDSTTTARRLPTVFASSPSIGPASFCAAQTGMIEITITTSATTLMIGSWFGRARFEKIQIGSVWSEPAVKTVTITSSNERPKASRPPASNAVPSAGSVTSLNVWIESAPRSDDASSNDSDVRRSLRDHVVVDDDDAERRVPDHDRGEAEADPDRLRGRCRSWR